MATRGFSDALARLPSLRIADVGYGLSAALDDRSTDRHYSGRPDPHGAVDYDWDWISWCRRNFQRGVDHTRPVDRCFNLSNRSNRNTRGHRVLVPGNPWGCRSSARASNLPFD